MREFDIDLTEYITKGYAPTLQDKRLVPGLDKGKEVIVTKSGLRARPDIFDLNEVFPQFGDENPKVFGLNKVPLCTNDLGTWRIDVAEPIKVSTLVNVDTVVDFYDFMFIANATEHAELLLTDGVLAEIESGESYSHPSTASGYKDAQAFIGYDNQIAWSSIGKFDFTLGVSGDAGNMTVPFPGDILRVLELDKYMVCYGDEGMCVLEPVNKPRGAWRVVKLPQMVGIGLRDFDSLASVGDKHLFIGNDDNLWELTAELKLNRLGYDYLLSVDAFTLTAMNLHHGIYLVGSDVSYIYTDAGLSSAQHVASSLIPYYTEYKIAGYPNKQEGYDQFEIRTNPLDFKHRQMKHIQAIEVGIYSPHAVECQIQWRRNTQEAFRETGWVRLSPEGYAHIPCSGVDFKIGIRGTITQDFELFSLKAKLKYENKSNLRGKYAY